MKFLIVFILSLFTSASFLVIERLAGIGWDFHPDSVTYATTSEDVYSAIISDWTQLPNNAYYVISYLLGQSVVLITLMNMTLFAITNSLIYKTIKYQAGYSISPLLSLLLLLNPYRVHLSTTMLKDTLVIFLMVLLLSSSTITRTAAFIAMFLIRVASPIYLLTLIPKRYLRYILLGSLFLMAIFWSIAIERILEFNDQEMQLREFDQIPTFQDLGFPGSILRGITWSLLAFSGTFALISPALAFYPVAVGSIMTLVFLKKVTGSLNIPIQLFIATTIFGAMVTGFTAYIRYIYPILVVWPIIAIKKND